jgi:hypothetical protein
MTWFCACILPQNCRLSLEVACLRLEFDILPHLAEFSSHNLLVIAKRIATRVGPRRQACRRPLGKSPVSEDRSKDIVGTAAPLWQPMEEQHGRYSTDL